MRIIQVISLFGVMYFIRAWDFRKIDSTATIYNLKAIGDFSTIGPHVKIGKNSEVGDYTSIAANVVIGDNSRIGDYCHIDQLTLVNNNVQINDYVNVDRQTVVQDECKLNDYSRVGSRVILSHNIFVDSYSSIGDNAFIGEGSIFDSYSSMQSSSRADEKAYLGKYSQVGSNALIGENAVIHKFALVLNREKVPKDEVRIKTPSSADLYSSCLPLNQIQQSDIDRVLNTSVADASNYLLDLMERHFDQLRTNCPSFDFAPLRLIKSLYMLRLHGSERYRNNCQGRTSSSFNNINLQVSNSTIIVVNQHGTFVNGQRITNDYRMNGIIGLSDEYQFGSKDTRNIIDNRAKNEIIKLLAIEHDAQRDLRVHGDTVCKMLEDILYGRRRVRCDS